MNAAIVALFAQLTISVTAPASVDISSPVLVSVVAKSATLAVPTITMPPFVGFSVTGSSAASRIVRSGSSPYAVVEVTYRLRAGSPGTHEIPPIAANVGSEVARSDSRAVLVTRAGQSTIQTPLIIQQPTIASLDPDRPVSVAVLGAPDTVYVGEQSTYEIAVFVDESLLRQRGAQTPAFVPPDLRGTLTYELPLPRGGWPPRQVGRRLFRPHVYRRAIFPLVPGRHVVPAATLDYVAPSSGSVFSRDETHTLRADSVVITALPLPAAGRPSDFSGAVGDYSLERSVSNLNLTVGEPFTVRMRVSGTGNIRLLPRPDLKVAWADVIPAGERIQINTDGGLVGGEKEFAWVVTPRESGTNVLEAVAYAFFDPADRRYHAASTRADTFAVLSSPTVVGAQRSLSGPAPLAIRRSYKGAEAGPVWRNPLFLTAIFGALLLAVPAAIFGKTRLPRTGRAARHNVATGTRLATGEVAPQLPELRRKLVRALERRVSMPGGASASTVVVTRALLRAGVSRETTGRTVDLLSKLDSAVFSGAPNVSEEFRVEIDACIKAVDSEAVRAASPIFTALLPVLFVLLPALRAQEPTSVQESASVTEHFAAGVLLYSEQKYDSAAVEFLRVTRLEPRSADGWVNLGAAAWHAADTAVAVVAWHRALRLQPSAKDVRRNLRMLPRSSAQNGSIPLPIPPNTTAVLALALIFVSSALAVIASRTKKRAPRLLAWVTASCGVALAIATVALHARITDRGVAVVTTAVEVRSLPSLEARAVTRLRPGELIRMREHSGSWSQVEVDGRSLGWVHQNDLLRVAPK